VHACPGCRIAIRTSCASSSITLYDGGIVPRTRNVQTVSKKSSKCHAEGPLHGLLSPSTLTALIAGAISFYASARSPRSDRPPK
jgi:hypothetical protein